MDLPPSSVDPTGDARQLARSLADLRALSQVVVDIGKSLNLDTVLRTSREGIQRVLHGDAGCFLLIQEEVPTLQIVEADTLPRTLRAELQKLILEPATVAGGSADSGNRSTVIVQLGDRIKQILKKLSISSYVMFPLFAQTRAVGILLVMTSGNRLLEPRTIDLLMSIGEQVGLAIENARLHSSIKNAEEWRREFMENSLDAFYEGEFGGRLTYVNEAACRLFGCDRETLLNMRVVDLSIDDMESRQAVSAELREKGILNNRNATIVTKTGEIRIVNYTSRVVHDDQGNPVRFQSISRDITEQRKTEETLRLRTQQLAVLNNIANILSHPLELEQSLDQVCQQVVSITGMDAAAVGFVDESRQFLNLVAQRGISDDLWKQVQRLGLDDPLTRAIALEGRVVAVDDVALYGGTGFAGPRAAGYHAGICMPIRTKETPIGAIFVASQVKTHYNQEDVKLMQNVSNQIGVAFENSNLYQQMQRRVHELDGLAQLSAACTSTLDPLTISRIAVEWTQKLLDVDLADLRLLKGERLYPAANKARRAEYAYDEPIPLGDLYSEFVEMRSSLQVSDLESEPRVPIEARRGFRALMAVPLLVRDEVIGTLAVAYSEPRQWSPRETDLLQTIANQVANTIDNAQLFQRVLGEQRKVQAIFDSGLSGLYATDAQAHIVMFNRVAERVSGWSFSEVKGRLWQEVFDNPEPLICKALADKEPAYAREGRELKTRDGRVIPVAEAVAPLYGEKGQVTGAVGAFWDLTREKAAELSRERFLMMVAHQLRSPLTALLSALQLLERQGLSKARRTKLWDVIRADGERLKKFADEFLDLEAAVKSPRPVRLEPLPIVPLVRSLVEEFRAESRGHRFRTRICKPEPTVHADPARVENVLRNLLDNAVSYSPENSLVTVSVRALDSTTIDIAVQDQGEGIPPEEHERVFEPFYRASKSAGQRGYGHGLGLSIAQGMVREMEGEIWVDSKKNRGAVFHFTLRRYK